MRNSDPIARDQMSIGKELNWVNKAVLIHSSPSTMICAEQIGRFETRQHVEGVGTAEVKAGHPLSELLIPKNTAPEAMLDTRTVHTVPEAKQHTRSLHTWIPCAHRSDEFTISMQRECQCTDCTFCINANATSMRQFFSGCESCTKVFTPWRCQSIMRFLPGGI